MEEKDSREHEGGNVVLEEGKDRVIEEREGQRYFTSLVEVAWPPLRVEKYGRNDRKYAHCLFLFLMLCSLAASIWTIYDAITDNSWLNEFNIEPYPFPVVTICGDGSVGRHHTILGHECYYMDYGFYGHDLIIKECESKVVENLEYFQGPCVVYNPRRS